MSDETRALAERLRDHTVALAVEIGERNVFRPQALAAAADFIRGEWGAQGHTVRSQSYRVGGIDCENLEVAIVGAEQRKEIVLLGAHYDTVAGSPGADDNASGVAALLEIGRLLAHALMVADTAFYRYPHYHTAFDTPD